MMDLVGKRFPVHDHGHVILVDYMGDDVAVCEAARTSYQKGTKQTSDDRSLIRYLMRHRHSTPFESCVLKFHVKLPIFVERQWARHRTAGWNEVSARYSELPEEYFVPDAESIRAQSKSNKQGRDGELDGGVVEKFIADAEWNPKVAFGCYNARLREGVARELARIILPLSTYTEKVWWINLHNLLHFLGLRMDSHAQKEIRDYANAIGYEIVKPLFPAVWEAFVDYRLEGMFLSRLEIEAIQNENVEGIKNKREREECIRKVEILGVDVWESSSDV